jgi:transposase-like protein
VWRYVYRAANQHEQVIDVFLSRRKDIAEARRFFTTALAAHPAPAEVITDRAPTLANVIEDLVPATFHKTGRPRTTGARPTTAGSRYDCDRCGA